MEDPSTHGSMFVLIILGSDKTTILVATSNNEYYTLYMSIGNIYNNVHHVHCNGVVLIGFLAIPKSMFLLSCFVFLLNISFQLTNGMQTMRRSENSIAKSFIRC